MTDELDTTEADEALVNLRNIRRRVQAVARAFDESLDTTPRGESVLDRLDMKLSRMTPEEYQAYFDDVHEGRRLDERIEAQQMREAVAISERNRAARKPTE